MPIPSCSEGALALIRDNLQDFGDSVSWATVIPSVDQKAAFTLSMGEIFSIIDVWIEDNMKAFVVIDTVTGRMSRMVVSTKNNERLFDLHFKPTPTPVVAE